MDKLMILDLKDYTNDMSVYEKYAVRAIIKKNDKLAMQLSNAGEYKIPGGSVEQGETYKDALIREVREETGMIVIGDSITEIGEIEEIREDVFQRGQKYICHSFYYICSVENTITQTNMTENELQKGYHLVWATAEEIYANNIKFQSEHWKNRDTKFIKLLIDRKVV